MEPFRHTVCSAIVTIAIAIQCRARTISTCAHNSSSSIGPTCAICVSPLRFEPTQSTLYTFRGKSLYLCFLSNLTHRQYILYIFSTLPNYITKRNLTILRITLPRLTNVPFYAFFLRKKLIYKTLLETKM